MAEKVELELKIKGGNKAVKTLGDLEKQLEKAREEIKGVEVGSDAFKKLATKIQDASSEVKTLEKQMEGLEPQQKAEAFLKMGEGIAGGFVVGQSAMALFGVESENLEKLQVKVQAAIGIAMGVRMMSEAALMMATAKRVAAEKLSMLTTKANILLTKGAVAVQKLLKNSLGLTVKGLKGLKAAVAATGIGLLVVGVSSLISSFSNAGKSAKQLAKDMKAINDEINDIEETYNREKIRRLDELNGVIKTSTQKNVSAKQDEIDIVNKKINQLKEEAEANAEYTALAGNMVMGVDAQTLAYKKLKEEGKISIAQGRSYKGVIDKLINKKRKLTETLLDLEVAVVSENIASNKSQKDKDDVAKKLQKDKDKKQADDDKKQSERDANREKREAKREKEAKELFDLKQELDLMRIEDENEREKAKIEQDRQNDLAEIERAGNKAEQLLLIKEKYDQLEAERQQKVDDAAFEKMVENNEKWNEEQAAKYQKETELKQIEADKQKEIDQKVADTKANMTAQGFELARTLGGKNEKIQKGIAVTETIFNTQKAVMRALADIPAPWGVPQAILHGAMGVAAVGNILSESMGDVSAGGDSTTEPMTPSTTGAFTLGGALPDQEPVKAYVVTDEMSDSQAQLSDIRRRSTI